MNKFCLTLDDYSPDPRTNDLTWCDKLVERFPDIKVNLFVSAAYCRLGEEPKCLSDYMEWVDVVAKNLSNNYRINLHGNNHRRTPKDFGPHNGKPVSNNDEWQYLSYGEAKLLGRVMLNEFDKVGLEHNFTFRPPGWKISKDAVRALQDLGIKCFAGDSKYRKLVKSELKVKWIDWNWDLITEPPAGDICAFGHNSNWCNNYIDKKRYNKIVKLLDSRDFDFVWVEEW